MITIQINDKVKIPYHINKIKCFTINKCDFLFLHNNGCEIIKWSPTCDTIETFLLEQEYMLICYDDIEDCYWAISECKPCLIQQLDKKFCVVDDIQISDSRKSIPIAIYCDDSGKGIAVNYPCEIVFLEKKDKKTTWYKNEVNNKNCMAYIFHNNYRVGCYKEYNHQIMQISLYCTENYINVCIPKEYKIVGITPSCCEKSCSCCFCVLYFDTCSKELVSIKYCVHYSDEPADPFPPHSLPDHCSIYEIIHSIALEEAGIAHILNAEGEKIQKAVAISSNIGELICVNESVKRTLTQVTLLEGMLYSKLETLANFDEFSNCDKYSSFCKDDSRSKE